MGQVLDGSATTTEAVRRAIQGHGADRSAFAGSRHRRASDHRDLPPLQLSNLAPEDQANLSRDLLDPQATKRAEAERTPDTIRLKFGPEAIIKGGH